MKILITGSSGYIGSRLCEIINKKYKNLLIQGLDLNLYTYNKENKFLIKKKDLRNVNNSDLYQVTSVIHLAALSNDPLGELNKSLTDDINYKATVRLASLAKKNKVKRFIFISSQSIYGISKYKKKTIKENDKNIRPITEYAKSKLKAEKYLLSIASKDFCVTILRPATVHGPSKNFRSDIVLNNLCASAYTTGKIEIKTNGKPYRPVLYIDDLCKVIIACLFKKNEEINRLIVNVGYPKKNFTIIQLAYLVKKVFKKSKVVIRNEQSHDERSYRVNFNKISKKFKTVINFKNKNIIDDIKKIKNFFVKSSFTKKDFKGPKTNRISMILKLIKEKKINKNLNLYNVQKN